MELIKKYSEEIERDLKIDDFNIKSVQLKLPSRKHYWVGRLIDAKITLNQLNSQKKAAKNLAVQTAIANAPVTISQTMAEKAAEESKAVREINEKIKDYTLLVEYLEKVEKIFSTMHWEIKNIIDINRSETA